VRVANRVFGIGLVVLAFALSMSIVWVRVIGPDWNRADAAYREAGAWLAGQGDRESIVVVGNPPGFTYHTGHPSIVMPNGDVETLLEAAERFGAKYALLDDNRPEGLAALYADPNSDAHFQPVARFGATILLEVAQR
jgi:hypothetical protein